MKMRFGDIYLYKIVDKTKDSGFSFIPVIIIINTPKDKNIVVAPIKRTDKSLYSPTHIFIGKEEGIRYNAMIELENSFKIIKSELYKYVSHIYNLNILLLISERYSGYLKGKYIIPKKENIRCLCRSCLSNYKDVPNYIIRRANLRYENKCTCDYCGNPGYNYIIIEK